MFYSTFVNFIAEGDSLLLWYDLLIEDNYFLFWVLSLWNDWLYLVKESGVYYKDISGDLNLYVYVRDYNDFDSEFLLFWVLII